MTLLAKQQQPHQPWPFPPSQPVNDPPKSPPPSTDSEVVTVAAAKKAPVLAEPLDGGEKPKPKTRKYPRYMHVRVAWIPLATKSIKDQGMPELWSEGGFTACYEVLDDIRLLRVGIARCSPNERYNLDKGRTVSWKRLSSLGNQNIWKSDSNEKRDYVRNAHLYLEFHVNDKHKAADVVADYMEKMISEDKDYKDYELQLVTKQEGNGKFRYVLI